MLRGLASEPWLEVVVLTDIPVVAEPEDLLEILPE